MPEEILDTDEICRCIIFDRAFQQELHVNEFLWRFDSSRNASGDYEESGVLRRLAPMDDDVHHFGCGLAAGQNEKNQPESGPKRRYYCGFRVAKFRNLPEDTDKYSISYINDEGAHVAVILSIKVTSRSARANCRTDAGLALAEQFGPPVPFICDCDANDQNHPINLWGEACLFKSINNFVNSTEIIAPS
jgi:hypothetical protein